jgi:SAM-dependent methyltransferase
MYRKLVLLSVVMMLFGMPAGYALAADAVKEAQDEAKEAAKEPDKKLRGPDIVYVPTPHDVVEKMLDMADVKKGDVVYDLGCGDGRIVIAAAKRGAKAIGYDIDPKRVKEARENVKKNKVEDLAKIEHEDVFTLDLSKANVVTLYLLPSLNVKLIPQLEKLKDGSRIVSHDFDMRGVTEDKLVKLTSKETSRDHRIYLWTTPLKKDKDAGKSEDE